MSLKYPYGVFQIFVSGFLSVESRKRKFILATRFHMRIKDSSCNKTFTALRANVRSFARVIPFMND